MGKLIMKANIITSFVVLILQDAEMQYAVPIKLMSHSLRWTFFEFIQENIQLFQICNLVNECVPHPQESMVDGEPVCSAMHYRAAAKTKKKKKS